MKVERLTEETRAEFIAYCRKHRQEVDDSYLYDDQLDGLEVDDEVNPTYLLMDEGRVVGAASLYRSDYFLKGSKARFRIFHSAVPSLKAYQVLWEKVRSHAGDLAKVFLFIDESNVVVRGIFEEVGFDVERISYLLERKASPVPLVGFPQGYTLGDFVFERDESVWCEVRNAAFAHLAGSETPITAGQVREMRDHQGHLAGGMKVLYCGDQPAGILNVEKEWDEGEWKTFIGLLAVKPEYQGKGLGRRLLREGLHYGREAGMGKALISVNGENEKAVKLYLKEGFEKKVVMMCYKYDSLR
ncbi:GNAT family N-acetyltransferase [Rossellomorea aquimaris]|uniref:GNAT family N-acetyltransferase n=1 Tax=Rossellomorea aquimaris TaxID=189382 RepID=UPI001CD44054|nr:GNAT family N-acetyltransferase [Rossellomorea aquimaris]MCA1056005.1 GNAT family N-acetyltransferase [Rossellomorea aquimaris]